MYEKRGMETILRRQRNHIKFATTWEDLVESLFRWMMVGVKSLWHLCPIEFIEKRDVKLYFKMSILHSLQLFSLMINLRCQLEMYEGHIVFQIYGLFLLLPCRWSLRQDGPWRLTLKRRFEFRLFSSDY